MPEAVRVRLRRLRSRQVRACGRPGCNRRHARLVRHLAAHLPRNVERPWRRVLRKCRAGEPVQRGFGNRSNILRCQWLAFLRFPSPAMRCGQATSRRGSQAATVPGTNRSRRSAWPPHPGHRGRDARRAFGPVRLRNCFRSVPFRRSCASPDPPAGHLSIRRHPWGFATQRSVLSHGPTSSQAPPRRQVLPFFSSAAHRSRSGWRVSGRSRAQPIGMRTGIRGPHPGATQQTHVGCAARVTSVATSRPGPQRRSTFRSLPRHGFGRNMLESKGLSWTSTPHRPLGRSGLCGSIPATLSACLPSRARRP